MLLGTRRCSRPTDGYDITDHGHCVGVQPCGLQVKGGVPFKGLSTNAPPCPVLHRAALRRALRLVDLVADWFIPEVRINQQPRPQVTKHDDAQHGVGQGGAFVDSPLRREIADGGNRDPSADQRPK